MRRIWRSSSPALSAHLWVLLDEDTAATLCGRKLPADLVPGRAREPIHYCPGCERAVDMRIDYEPGVAA